MNTKLFRKLILILILSSTKAYGAINNENCVYGDPTKWNDRCQDIRLEKTFGPKWTEIKEFFFAFKEAVKRGDKEAAIQMMEYDMYGMRYACSFVENREIFLKYYDQILTNHVKELIAEASYKDISMWDLADNTYNLFGNAKSHEYHVFQFIARCNDKDLKPNEVKKPEECNSYYIKIVRLTQPDEQNQDAAIEQTFGSRWTELKQFFFAFQDAVRHEDKAAVAKMVNYPLVTRGGTLKNENEFISSYDHVINEPFKKWILETNYSYLWLNNGMLMSISDPVNLTSAFEITIACKDEDVDSPLYDVKTCAPYSIKLFLGY